MNPKAAAAAAEYAAASRGRAARARNAARGETDPERRRALERAVEIHECAAAAQERAVEQLLRSASAMETHGRATRWSARDLADVLLPQRNPSARPAQAGAVVEPFVNALVNRDLDAMLGCLTEDVYFVSGEDFGGHAGVREWFRLDSTDQPARELVDMVELDDSHVFVEVCTWRAGGSDTRGCVYTVHDGKIAAIELFANPEHAYRARDVVPG